MNFLDNYDLGALDKYALITIEYSVKETLIRLSDQSLELAKKKRKNFWPSYIIGFMSTYVVMIMIEWLSAEKAKLYRTELINFINEESYRVHEECIKYTPHITDDSHLERMNLFTEVIKPFSMMTQTIQIEKSICDNAIESAKILVASGTYGPNCEDNIFSFFPALPFIYQEVKKLTFQMQYTLSIDSALLSGLLAKQFAKQVAWLTGFYADLDKDETIEGIMKCTVGVINTFDFSEKLTDLKELKELSCRN